MRLTTNDAFDNQFKNNKQNKNKINKLQIQCKNSTQLNQGLKYLCIYGFQILQNLQKKSADRRGRMNRKDKDGLTKSNLILKVNHPIKSNNPKSKINNTTTSVYIDKQKPKALID